MEDWLDSLIYIAFTLDPVVCLQPDDRIIISRSADEFTVVLIQRFIDTDLPRRVDAYWCQASSDDDRMMFRHTKTDWGVLVMIPQ